MQNKLFGQIQSLMSYMFFNDDMQNYLNAEL